MKTISRLELQEILGIRHKHTLYRWERDAFLPKRIGMKNNSPIFNLHDVIVHLESSAFIFKVTPTALIILKDKIK